MDLRKIGEISGLVVLGLIGVLTLPGLIPSPVISLVLFILVGAGAYILYQEQSQKQGEQAQNYEERMQEARKLRYSRERERAFYEMASTLSSTLDREKVLNAAQNIGMLVTRDTDSDTRLVSAALLFEGEQNQLRIITGKGLTRNDFNFLASGKRGILGLALKQSEPVFAGKGRDDPELQYLVGFQDTKSILAVALRAGYQYGAMIFGANQPGVFAEEYVELLKAIGTLTAIALQNTSLYQDVLHEKERILEVEEGARKKLSRDLHDGPTQDISAVVARINHIRTTVQSQNPQLADMLGKIEDLGRNATREIRHMLFTLRPLVLETQGLAAALKQLASKMKNTYEQNVVVEAQPGAEKVLDMNAQGALFYVTEEALTNARKYAQATQIRVRLYVRGQAFILEIEDNGIGFKQEAIASGRARNSLGMINMRERAEIARGRLRLDSKEGVGTRISVVIPLKEVPNMAALAAQAAQDIRQAESRPPTPATPPQSAAPAPPAAAPTPAASSPPEPQKPIPFADRRSPES